MGRVGKGEIEGEKRKESKKAHREGQCIDSVPTIYFVCFLRKMKNKLKKYISVQEKDLSSVG